MSCRSPSCRSRVATESFKRASQRQPLFAVALISAAALGHEILLTRLFALVHWSQFAAVAISLALLGLGASGSLVSLLQQRLASRFAPAFVISTLAFGLLAPGSFLLAQALPFNPLELAWDRWQIAWLSLQFLILSLPFVTAGSAIGMALTFRRQYLNRLYAFDLFGAGIGALLVLVLLMLLPTGPALVAISLLGILAGLVATWELRMATAWRWAGFIWMLLILIAGGLWIRPIPSQFKDLSQARQVMGAGAIARVSGVQGELVALDNDQVPYRHAPGISLSLPARLPKQIALFHDGNHTGGVTRFDGNLKSLAFTASLSSALPYRLLDRPDVLVLEPGGGLPILQALFHQARQIQVIESSHLRARLLDGDLAGFSGGLYQLPGVRRHVTEPRHYLDGQTQYFDLIQLDRTLSADLAMPGLAAREADWLLTIQGLDSAFATLNRRGMLAITHWLHLPPRDSLRVFITAISALDKDPAIAEPSRHLAYVRGWKTATLLITRSPITPDQGAAIQEFARERSFDIAFLAHWPCDAANRYNQLARADYCRAMLSLAGKERAEFLRQYAFDVRPLTDDRPYGNNYTRWSRIWDLLNLEAGGGLAQIDWGHALLVATLLQALPLSMLLILAPLATRRLPKGWPGQNWRLFGYFTAIGLGFMALEIVCIEQLQRYLGEPVHAISVVLAGFLVFAGIGSAWAERWQKRLGDRIWPILAICLALVVAGQQGLFGWLVAQTSTLPLVIRLALALLWLAPLAWLLGLPLPLGMRRLAPPQSNDDLSLLPWAWGINGCASVVGAVLAALLVMDIGFSATLILALLAYGIAFILSASSPSSPLAPGLAIE